MWQHRRLACVCMWQHRRLACVCMWQYRRDACATGAHGGVQGKREPMSSPTFATGWNLTAIEDAYQRWQADPSAVDDRWRLFFEGFELGAAGAPSKAVTPGQAAIGRLIYSYRAL